MRVAIFSLLSLILLVIACNINYVSAIKKKKNGPSKQRKQGFNFDNLLKDAQKLLGDLDTDKLLEKLSKDGEMSDLIDRTKKMLGKGPGEFDREFKNLLDTLSGKPGEKCKFKCTNKKLSPVAKLGWTPRKNGCGVEGLTIPAEQMDHDFTPCCNAHDVCYDTCLSDKTACDKAFLDCMNAFCVSKELQEKELKNCKMNARALYQATDSLGCTFYLNSQKDACDCADPSDRSEL